MERGPPVWVKGIDARTGDTKWTFRTCPWRSADETLDRRCTCVERFVSVTPSGAQREGRPSADRRRARSTSSPAAPARRRTTTTPGTGSVRWIHDLDVAREPRFALDIRTGERTLGTSRLVHRRRVRTTHLLRHAGSATWWTSRSTAARSRRARPRSASRRLRLRLRPGVTGEPVWPIGRSARSTTRHRLAGRSINSPTQPFPHETIALRGPGRCPSPSSSSTCDAGDPRPGGRGGGSTTGIGGLVLADTKWTSRSRAACRPNDLSARPSAAAANWMGGGSGPRNRHPLCAVGERPTPSSKYVTPATSEGAEPGTLTQGGFNYAVADAGSATAALQAESTRRITAIRTGKRIGRLPRLDATQRRVATTTSATTRAWCDLNRRRPLGGDGRGGPVLSEARLRS